MGNCGLTGIGPVVSKLISLEELELSGDPIYRFPEGLSHLKKLKKLNLQNCELTEIGIDITQLTSLEELDLLGNPIKRLPECLKPFMKMHELWTGNYSQLCITHCFYVLVLGVHFQPQCTVAL